VNGAWPETVPPLTGPEALSAIKVLWRVGSGRPFKDFRKLKLTSGNRRNHFYRSGWIINPDRGWHGLVHSISHRIEGSHGTRHAGLEKTLIEYVISHGWLDGKLKRETKEKAPRDLKTDRHARVLAKLKSWESKRRRAETAIKKLKRQSKYYERQSATI
jgi:hypothetical protein